MAAAADGVCRLNVLLMHGLNRHYLDIPLPEDEAGDILILRHLQVAIFKATEVPVHLQRVIFLGKQLINPLQSLKGIGMKNGSKVMLIGKKPLPEESEDYKNMCTISKQVDKKEKHLSSLTHDLDGLHRGYLYQSLHKEALSKMEKQILGFIEGFMQALEQLDALNFDEVFKEAKDKRKRIVSKTQNLLQLCDKLLIGIRDMRARIHI